MIFFLFQPIIIFISVAPFVGAWIEIMLDKVDSNSIFVAPFVGAWIEISLEILIQKIWYVAPFVGAWIEMEWIWMS